MHTAELIRWAAVAAMTATLMRWPKPGAPFWAIAAGQPFVLACTTVGSGRFRAATLA